MNATLKTILLTILTLSVFAIAIVELTGVSNTALINKFGKGFGKSEPHEINISKEDQAERDFKVKNLPKTTMEVPDTKFIFGKMKEGDKARHTWIVKNTGTVPLMIANVQTSCGCTAPFYPKEPILPGKQGEVTLEFNSAGKKDHVIKNALIIANSDNSPLSIGFEADVLPQD